MLNRYRCIQLFDCDMKIIAVLCLSLLYRCIHIKFVIMWELASTNKSYHTGRLYACDTYVVFAYGAYVT